MRKDKIKSIKINYFLVPFSIILFVTGIITYMTVNVRVEEKYQELKNTTLEIAKSYSSSLYQANQSSEIITELLDEKIRLASQAIMLIEDKEDNQALQSISKTFQIDQINLFSPVGEILYSTNEEQLGWKVYDDHPVNAFMTSGKTILIEEVRRDTEDGRLYKFGYAKNPDGSVVQLGILAENIQAILADFELSNLVNKIAARDDVQDVFFINNSYEIVSSNLNEMIGRNVEDSQLRTELAENRIEINRVQLSFGNYYRIAVPIFSENVKIGSLLLHWPTDKIVRAVTQIVLFGVGIFFIVILIIGGILFYAYHKSKINMKIAYCDELTGLPNSKYLMDHLDDILGRTHKRKKAIFLLNFVRFDNFNMTYGYSYGNQILKKIVARIECNLEADEKIFRFDGDRFVIMFNDYQDQAALEVRADQLLKHFEEPVLIGLEKQYLELQVAIVELAHSYVSTDKLLQDATLAISHMKHHPTLKKIIFNDMMADNLKRQDQIVKALRKVISGKETAGFYLMFQPKLDLATNTIVGFEALARLKVANIGNIPPDEFIAIAENNLLIFDLGLIILQQACQFIQKLQQTGYANISVAINISGHQLLREDFLTKIKNCIDEYQDCKQLLEFEITESVLFDHYEQVNNILGEIQKMGIKTSLDDFGTGFSSYSRLEELQIENVKIDKLFIDKIIEVDEKHLILSDIISMSLKMGLQVIAEGVESEEQVVYLRKHHCDMIQGYHLSRPLFDDQALDFLRGFNKDKETN